MWQKKEAMKTVKYPPKIITLCQFKSCISQSIAIYFSVRSYLIQDPKTKQIRRPTIHHPTNFQIK